MTPPSQPADKLPLARIGRFHITGKLGSGALGAVYLGHDPVIDRDVAIKTFHPVAGTRQQRLRQQQLINEARAAGRLSHPHIVTIFDVCSDGATPYIAMELLQGRTLDKLLADRHPFSPEEIVTIIWKLSDALDHAHRQGVVHRDIKPGNIFLVGGHQPKLLDFGIARAPNRVARPLAAADEAVTLFRHNLLGTPNYMSPEQAGGQPADHRTDIYSLGAVLYEMLTGSTPFQARDTDKLLHLITHATPARPQTRNPAIPAALSGIAMKALNRDPHRRYQSAHEMALDLKRYLVAGKRARRRLRLEQPQTEKSSIYRPPWLLAGGGLLIAAIALVLVLRHLTLFG